MVDLFAGVGGLTLGFLKPCDNPEYCYDVRLLSDIDPSASYTFKKNYPRIPYWVTDLSSVKADEICRLAKVPPREFDLLIGGPPCQGF